MRNLTIEEQMLAQIDSGWVNLMYDRTMKGARLGTFRHTKRDLSTYTHCYVGDIRSQLGMSRKYAKFHFDEFCHECIRVATSMGNFIDHAYNRQYYLTIVRRFLTHLKVTHHWVPKTTA